MRIRDRLYARQYRKTIARIPSPAERAKMREWCDDISETACVMYAELGVAWVDGPNIRGLGLDYVRGKRQIPGRAVQRSPFPPPSLRVGA